MKLIIKPAFVRQVKKIDTSYVLKGMHDIINEIKEAESISKINNIKKLQGSNNAYRIRIGEYRIGFTLIDGTVYLAAFAHRKDIYKYFP